MTIGDSAVLFIALCLELFVVFLSRNAIRRAEFLARPSLVADAFALAVFIGWALLAIAAVLFGLRGSRTQQWAMQIAILATYLPLAVDGYLARSSSPRLPTSAPDDVVADAIVRAANRRWKVMRAAAVACAAVTVLSGAVALVAPLVARQHATRSAP